MTPVGFECVNCHHRLSVSADWAGKAVRCPKCQVVMKIPAPRAASPAPPSQGLPTPRNVPRSSSDTDSIFSDPDDGDAESVFSGSSDVRRPVLPPRPPDATQSTIRVPGVADPQPVVKPPVSPVAVDPDEGSDPFGAMVDEVMSRARHADEDGPPSEFGEGDDDPPAPPRWMTWALVGLSVYAALATAVAVWGWVRPAAEPPPVQAPTR